MLPTLPSVNISQLTTHGQADLSAGELLLACNADAELVAPGSFLMVRSVLFLE